MFFLRNAWIVPALPVLSFCLILFFGKRLPKKGAEIGVAALAIAFAFSLLTAGAWIGQEAKPAAEVVKAHAAAAAPAEGDHAAGADTAGGHATTATTVQGGEGAGGAHELSGETHHEEKLRPAVERKLFTWFEMGGLKVEFGTHIDG
ncbi:MAG TPA: hypothetical protein VGO92_08350, partial [Acidimicrobiales bacterium]|nr:hypothetical protein [Acidimicrobiales bacterium]